MNWVWMNSVWMNSVMPLKIDGRNLDLHFMQYSRSQSVTNPKYFFYIKNKGCGVYMFWYNNITDPSLLMIPSFTGFCIYILVWFPTSQSPPIHCHQVIILVIHSYDMKHFVLLTKTWCCIISWPNGFDSEHPMMCFVLFHFFVPLDLNIDSIELEWR